MKKYQIKIILSLILTSLFIACNGPVEVKEQFGTETSFRPDINAGTKFRDVMNDILIDEAEKAGSDSVIQFESEDMPRISDYKDVAFLVISNKESLIKALTDYGPGQKDFSVEIANIDFDKNFAFVVANPSNSPVLTPGGVNNSKALYFNKVFDMATEDSIRKIKLETSRLGNVTEGLAILSQRWKSHVYILERKGCNRVLLELDKNKYRFSITK